MRAAVAVRNVEGEVFGVLVIKSLAQPLLDAITTPQLPNVQQWVTDAAGHYLWHPQPGKAFAHELAPPGQTWQSEFSAAFKSETIAPERGLPSGTTQSTVRGPDGTDWLMFTRTLQASQATGVGGLVLHSGLPVEVLSARAQYLARGQILLVWTQGLFVVALLTFLVLRWERLTGPEASAAANTAILAGRRVWLIGLGVGLAVLLAGFIVLSLIAEEAEFRAHEDASFRSQLAADRMVVALRAAEKTAEVLAQLHPETIRSQVDFDRRVGDLSDISEETLVVQWSPQGIVRFCHPLAGNEQAIGHDLRADPRSRELIAATIASGRARWDGPFPLLQGGIGMVYRVPVYREGTPASE